MTKGAVRRSYKMKSKPIFRPDGFVAYFSDGRLLKKQDEVVYILSMITDRRLFGEIYCGLQPDYFFEMQQDSGVLVAPIVSTKDLIPGATRPGDIDLLVIPYEGQRLIVNLAMAIEVKVIRASFQKQEKSPNEFGFSQAEALRDLGFPFSAVIHLISSDGSPQDNWRPMLQATVIDESGRCGEPQVCLADMMPADLMNRAFGRLLANSPDSKIGLVAAHLEVRMKSLTGPELKRPYGVWMPECRRALRNNDIENSLGKSILRYYENNRGCFQNNPRFDPSARSARGPNLPSPPFVTRSGVRDMS